MPQCRKHDDQARLVEAWSNGDREAMALALLDIAGSIIQSKTRVIPHSLDRDDLAQDAAIAALERLATYSPAKGSLRSYTYGSIRFTILERTRKEIRRVKRFRYCPQLI